MLSELAADAGNELSAKAIERLSRLYDLLKIRGYDKYVAFDLGMLSKYQYYTGIVFKAFALGSGSSIATGGRYDTLLSYFGKNAPAVGFVILPDEVEKLLERQGIEFPGEETISEIFFDPGDPGKYEMALEMADNIRKRGGRAVLKAEEV
jgi:ATP phosphoribosyltransferase regulatory subunit